MAEKPILYSGPMVQAILDGRKTQTRRLMKPQPEFNSDDGSIYQRDHRGLWQQRTPEEFIKTAPYKPGDLLWVREKFTMNEDKGIWYAADCDIAPAHEVCEYPDGTYFEGNWKPSIHMPRWASRITLEVTDVRAERLQDISEEDAIAEGMVMGIDETDMRWNPTQAFKNLWDSIYGSNAWRANPWVWAYTFRRVI